MEGQKRKQRKGGEKKENRLLNNKGKGRNKGTVEMEVKGEKEKNCPGPARKNIEEYPAGGSYHRTDLGKKKPPFQRER
jgi:hypothetical protein